MFQKLNFIGILKKLVAETTTFPTTSNLQMFTIISRVGVKLNRAYDRLLISQESKNTPEVIDFIRACWGTHNVFFTQMVSFFYRLISGISFQTRSLCHAAAATAVEAVGAALDRFPSLHDKRIVFAVPPEQNDESSTQNQARSPWEEGTTTNSGNTNKLDPINDLRRVLHEGDYFLLNMATLIRLSEVEHWSNE
jgi:hypothetical protein